MSSLTAAETSVIKQGVEIVKAQGIRKQSPAAVFVCAFFLSGCVATGPSVESAPVQAFRDSVATLQAASETALAAERDRAYFRFARERGEVNDFAALQLESVQPMSPFEMQQTGNPLFRSIDSAHESLGQLHDLLLRYCDALLSISGPDGVATFDADAEAGALRDAAESFAASADVSLDVPDGVFFGFAEIARNYLESRRRDEFDALINASQPTIARVAELAQQLVTLSALGLQAEYAAAFSAMTDDVDSLSASRRARLPTDLLELNEETLHQLAVLGDLNAAYGTLPSTHARLATASSARDLGLSEIAEYLRSIRRRYNEFERSN